MKPHRFDPISMLLGVAVVVLGIASINSRLGNVINDRPDALIPLILLGLGVVAIAIATRRTLHDVDGSLQDVDGSGDDQYDSAE